MCAAGYEWLFVLGHMRSGSSLLVHLLNSNPEVLGYGETHIQYQGRRSVVQLHDHVSSQFEAHDEPPGWHYRYVMDKILWPHIHNDDLLHQVPLSVIVIVRRPEATLPSILSWDLEGIRTPETALRYYVERLGRVRRLLEGYDAPFAFTRYEDLTGRTEEALLNISEYLSLDERLTPTYDTMWATGTSGIGDSSENIKEGRVRSTETSSYDVDLDPAIIGRARDRYRAFCSFCDDHSY
ncbi:sulfotransferase [Salinibacter ruber]|uniref:sulfotransferase n=1 Tax=Salinibacter ruber TaxID=146919 RepID=UPI0013C30C6D|nr:sulfotransferase [Salinibacter ruber]